MVDFLALLKKMRPVAVIALERLAGVGRQLLRRPAGWLDPTDTGLPKGTLLAIAMATAPPLAAMGLEGHPSGGLLGRFVREVDPETKSTAPNKIYHSCSSSVIPPRPRPRPRCRRRCRLALV